MTIGTGNAQLELARGGDAPAPRTLFDVLVATAATHPDATALEDPAGSVDYAALLDLVRAQADDLARRGVRRGDRVGVRIPSGGRDLYLSILAVLAAGAAYVPVDADDPEERATLVFGEAGVVGVIGAGGVLRDRDGTELPVTDPAASAEPPARDRRRVDHLHVRVDRGAEGCGGHSPQCCGVRGRRGSDVPAGGADRSG